MSNYEKQLEARVEQLEKQLQESEKQQCRDFEKLKEMMIIYMENKKHSETTRHVRNWIKSLGIEDNELKEASEKHSKWTKELLDRRLYGKCI